MKITVATFESRRNVLVHRFIVVLLCAGLWPALLPAQFTSTPQASTQQEYDQYLAILAASNSRALIAAGQSFEKAFPQSAMLANVYKIELSAWIEIGDSKNAVLVGERALRLVPNNVDLMSEVAYLIADTESDSASLSESKKLALGALELLDKLQIPRTTSPQEWKMIRGSIESKAHSALGLIAFKQGLQAESIAQFESALQPGVVDQSPIFYRLGRLYHLAGQQDKARSALKRAISSRDPELRHQAELELAKLPSN